VALRMDPGRSTAARPRFSDAIPLPGGGPADPGGAELKRPLPVGSAILWTPTVDGAPTNSPYPIFITQSAFAAVQAHVEAKPRGATSLGFLAGNRFECPDTGTAYVVIASAIHLPWSISGDHLRPALSQGWAVVQEEVRKNHGQLLGWYHTHHGVDPKPSPADIEAHAMLFAEPWHVALVVTPGHAPLGGFFRIATDGASASQYLPFYELLDAASLLPDGRKVSDLAWVNYRTEESIFTSDRVSNPGLEVQPRLLFPDNVEESIPGAAPSPARHQRVARVARLAGYAALGVVAGAVLFNVYHALASSRGPVKAGPVAAPSPRDRVDRMADTVALAVGAFDLRARLFDGRKMACADLARGLVDLEERWTSYNAARKDDAGALDSVRNVRDRSLYSDVDAVERRFERSKCARP